jgi:hypothetical protein
MKQPVFPKHLYLYSRLDGVTYRERRNVYYKLCEFQNLYLNYLCSVAIYVGSCLLCGLEFSDTIVANCIVGRVKVLLWKTMKIGEYCEDPLKRSYRLLHPACRNTFLLLVLTWIEFVKKGSSRQDLFALKRLEQCDVSIVKTKEQKSYQCP